MHGDLAFWNLRRYRSGEVMLLDWEDAGWGPPHADLVRALMTAPDGKALAATLPGQVRLEAEEAAAFWRSRLGVTAADGDPTWVRKTHAVQAENLSFLIGAGR
jgi:aminoglycoside phosphotransferase (APT) family kinase protein